MLSELLKIDGKTKRADFAQSLKDAAGVSKLKWRVVERRVLNRAEIEEIGYEFGLLRRLK